MGTRFSQLAMPNSVPTEPRALFYFWRASPACVENSSAVPDTITLSSHGSSQPGVGANTTPKCG